MLLTNQQLDKLAASHANFKARGMLEGDILQAVTSVLEVHKIYFVCYIILKAHCPLQEPQVLQLLKDNDGYGSEGSDVPGPWTMAFTKLGKAIGMFPLIRHSTLC
jgi:hypothetical protein